MGGGNPAYPLDILGADDGGSLQIRLANVLTNETMKLGGVGARHYLSAEEDFVMVGMVGTSADGIVLYGGGDGGYNAATLHRWYTADDNVTTMGTKTMELTYTQFIVKNDWAHEGTKVGLFNVTPATQPPHENDPTGGSVIDVEARAAIVNILAGLETVGLRAAA